MDGREGLDHRSVSWHDGFSGNGKGSMHCTSTTAATRQVMFVGYAEFDMDGRHQKAGEIDRAMTFVAQQKYPCSRPATLDEYNEGKIHGLPEKNHSGRDVVFAGPGATGCELYHTNTLGAQKRFVRPGDAFDGDTGALSLYGRKAVICVYPVERLKRQSSLTQFGLARSTVGKSGRLKGAGSLASLKDRTPWCVAPPEAISGSTNLSKRTC